jgi:hypothetical protein
MMPGAHEMEETIVDFNIGDDVREIVIRAIHCDSRVHRESVNISSVSVISTRVEVGPNLTLLVEHARDVMASNTDTAAMTTMGFYWVCVFISFSFLML